MADEEIDGGQEAWEWLRLTKKPSGRPAVIQKSSCRPILCRIDRREKIPKAMEKIGKLKETEGENAVNPKALETYNKYTSLEQDPEEQEQFVSDIMEYLGFQKDSSSGISQGSAERAAARPASSPANGTNAASSARQQDYHRPGKEFFEDQNRKPGERHRCFVRSGDHQESEGWMEPPSSLPRVRLTGCS